MDDFVLKPWQKLLIQNPNDLIGIFWRLLGPIDCGGVGGCIDKEEVVIVFRGCGSGVSSGTKAKINGGVFRRSFLPKHLLELQRVVVGEEDVVVG
jgi:hypothetical protein